MRIPLAIDERLAWLNETLDRLRRSLETRRTRYGSWRTWYLHGNSEWGARYNKIGPQLNTLASTLYAPRSVRFALNSGPVAADAQFPLQEVAADRLRAQWGHSGADDVYSTQTLWSLAYGTTIVKHGWSEGSPTTMAVAPGDFGVWRDDLRGLDGQQAMLHIYRLDSDTVREWLIRSGMPEIEAQRWIKRWGDGQYPEQPAESTIAIGAMNPIIWNGSPPSGAAGGVTDWGATAATYEANDVPTLEVEEVWVRDDRTNDWRIFQMIERDLVISDRPNDFLPHHHPFVDLTVDPVEEYFWGYSLVAQLIPLQAWREKRMNQLDRLFARQANPPMVASGFMGVTDEKSAAVMRRGGLISSQTPGAKIDLLSPQINELSFSEISEIDMMFNETLGLTAALQGATDPGIRGGEQARAVMGAGAGRLTRRMMAVERAVAQGASLLFALLRRYDPVVLATDEGQNFVMAQIPGDVTVEVAAHSASPVFAADAQRLALMLLENGIADKTDFLDLADPPMAQALKMRLKKREKKHEEQIKQMVAEIPVQERGNFFTKLIGGKGR